MMVVARDGLQTLTSLAFAFIFVNIFCWSDGSSFYQQILTWWDKEKKSWKVKPLVTYSLFILVEMISNIEQEKLRLITKLPSDYFISP